MFILLSKKKKLIGIRNMIVSNKKMHEELIKRGKPELTMSPIAS